MACDMAQFFSGFSKLTRQERYQRLNKMGALSQEDINYLNSGGVKEIALAEKFIENVIGYFQLPLGIACYFNIDGIDKVIPMAVEETSIIAALSKTAKWISEHGSIQTKTIGNTVIGQIQISTVKNLKALQQFIKDKKDFLIEHANENVAKGLVRRGGGVKEITLRILKRPDEKTMAVIHVHMDCCDAMGANIINQTLEFLKEPIENITNETVSMCILSNLSDSKLTEACVTINDVPAALGTKIEEASLFAELDPYRAATHNKGVLNGIDPVLIATGNDWRAVEAGIHAYAARSGQYKAITTWRYKENVLAGKLVAPISVGIVGGVTALHPSAQMSLRMLKVDKAEELARIIAAVGLVQNLGAIRALTTEGIIQGHMKLHIDNLILNTDANEQETFPLKKKLEQWLKTNKRVSLETANELLKHIRHSQPA